MLLPLRDDYPRVRLPPVVIALIALNTAVFLFELFLPPLDRVLFAHAFGMVPNQVVHGHTPQSVLTAMFIHGDVFHLLGNMWFLWVFGQRAEDAMGSVRFAIFYLLAGVVAAGTQILVNPVSLIPMVGASGAIAGVLGAYARIFPRARVRSLVFLIIFVFIWTLPAWWVLGLWFVGQFLSATSGAPGVAWFAHIGGFSIGYLLARVFVPRGRETRPEVVYSAPP
jgi:membrane associated rhomboid family serine protease